MASFWDLAYICGAPWDTGQPPIELTELIEERKLEPCRVLDVGCGRGTSVIYLASRGFDASGLDTSRVAINKAKGNASRHSVECHFYRLDFTDSKAIASAGLSSFDLVIDIGCYHSLSSKERDRYTHSLLQVSHIGTMYLLWAFLRSSGRGFGPPGVDPEEIEGRLSKNFQVRERHELEGSYRNMLFYVMERVK